MRPASAWVTAAGLLWAPSAKSARICPRGNRSETRKLHANPCIIFYVVFYTLSALALRFIGVALLFSGCSSRCLRCVAALPMPWWRCLFFPPPSCIPLQCTKVNHPGQVIHVPARLLILSTWCLVSVLPDDVVRSIAAAPESTLQAWPPLGWRRRWLAWGQNAASCLSLHSQHTVQGTWEVIFHPRYLLLSRAGWIT